MLINDIAGSLSGKTIVVMGGAPCLPDDVERVSGDVYISANQHGLMLRDCDFAVYVDYLHQVSRRRMKDLLAGTPTISPCFDSDYRIPDWPKYGFVGNCGFHALWMAYVLGGAPVVACGFENYTGGTYWHNRAAQSSGFSKSPSYFSNVIARLKNLAPGAIRSVSGPLTRHFPVYDPNEVVVRDDDKNFMESPPLIDVTPCMPFSASKTPFEPGKTYRVTSYEMSKFKRFRLSRG